MHDGAGPRDQKTTGDSPSSNHFYLSNSQLSLPRCWGSGGQAPTGIRDILSHSPCIPLVVAQLVPRYCKGRHETK